jgi:fructose-specific phosphotransferase system IIA component
MDSKQLAAFFDADLFMLDTPVASKADLFRRMTDVLYEKGKVGNKNVVLQTILAREELGSTGLGHGVAVPHSRSLMTKSLQVVYCRTADPLDYDSPDGEPVRLVFLIMAPPQDPANQYLPVLGKLVEFISSAEVRAQLLQLKSFDEFKQLLLEG